MKLRVHMGALTRVQCTKIREVNGEFRCLCRIKHRDLVNDFVSQ